MSIYKTSRLIYLLDKDGNALGCATRTPEHEREMEEVLIQLSPLTLYDVLRNPEEEGLN